MPKTTLRIPALVSLLGLFSTFLSMTPSHAATDYSSPVEFSGHYYQLVQEAQNLTWDSARSTAEAASFQGMAGHLVSITSREENDFVRDLANGNSLWLGARSTRAQGIFPHSYQSWTWFGGPDDGTSFSVCSNDVSSSCRSTFANWDTTTNSLQPDLTWGEDALVMIGQDPSTRNPGAWHDCYASNNCSVKSFVIEFEPNVFPTQKASNFVGFTGYQGRTEAQAAVFEGRLVVNGVGGTGVVNFLNLETLQVEQSVEVGEYGNHFLYPLVSGSELLLSNSFGSNGTFLRKFDKKSQSFGERVTVCQAAGYDKGVAANGKLYIPCTDRLVVVNPANLQIEQTLLFQGHAVQPAVWGNNIWIPIHDGQILKFDLTTERQVGTLAGCYSSQSIHVIMNFLVCTEIGRVSTYTLEGSLLGQTWLPGDGLGAYYRSEDASGVWICNMSLGLISHFNPALGAIDKIYRTSGYSTGSVTLNSALFVATGDGKITRFGKYLRKFSELDRASVIGAPSVGRVLKVSTDIAEAGVTKSYQWLRDGLVLTGEKAPSYQISSADAGSEVAVIATISKIGFENRELISESLHVPLRTFRNVHVPKLVGTPKVFSVLSVPKSSWGKQAQLNFSWFRNNDKILEEVSGRYEISLADLGSKISVLVCATQSGYERRCIKSLETTSVSLANIEKRPTPRLSYSLSKGEAHLKVTSNNWPSQVEVSYVWILNGTILPNVQGPEWDLSLGGGTQSVQVQVSASRLGHKTEVALTKPVTLDR